MYICTHIPVNIHWTSDTPLETQLSGKDKGGPRIINTMIITSNSNNDTNNGNTSNDKTNSSN